MTDLRTTYLGLSLSSPIVASASPLTGHLDALVALEANGAGAVVLPSLFEEQLTEDALHIDRLIESGPGTSEAPSGWFPPLGDYNTGADGYLSLVEQARRRLTIPVIASLNGVTPGGWLRYAMLLQQAGADAMELNLYEVVADPRADAAEVEARYIELVDIVTSAVEIPVAVKLSPYFTALGHAATAIMEAGAAGLVLFNRFYQPDISLDDMAVVPRLRLSTNADVQLPLRWIALLRDHIAGSLAASGGVHGPTEALKLLLAGADVVMMTSALLQQGPAFVADVLRGITAWMGEQGYESVDEMRGVLRATPADVAAYGRAAYVRTLTSFAYTPAAR